MDVCLYFDMCGRVFSILCRKQILGDSNVLSVQGGILLHPDLVLNSSLANQEANTKHPQRNELLQMQ